MCKVLAISGYKPYELGIFQMDHPSISYIKLAIKRTIIQLLDDGLEWVLISGQLGVELWAAEVVFELQIENPELKVAVITPFLEQEKNWNETNKEWYQSILTQADFIDSVSKKVYEKPWQFRLKNQFFVEKSNGLLLLYDNEKEGSPRFLYETALKYQETHLYPIHIINFYDLQSIIEEEEFNRNEF